MSRDSRYNSSAKGRRRNARYENSEKARARMIRYYDRKVRRRVLEERNRGGR